VAVGAGGEIVWAEGFGWADVEKRTPVTPRTRFRIGHASKPVTSAAVGLLMEQRTLHLDDEIQTYVPSYPRKDWPVTLRQLMGHTAGIRHYADRDHLPSEPCTRASEQLRFFANDPLRFKPETAYGYSTYGWILVSAAVEAAAGEPFFSFMRARVFEPLGMRDTTVDGGAEAVPTRATFYYPRFDNDLSPAPAVDYSCFAGAAGFLSTPSDLVRFGMAFESGALLPSATVRMFQTRQLLASGEETAYGLGWMLETVPLAGDPARMASHASLTPVGGSTSFVTFPERGLAVAVTANTSFKHLRFVALQIAEAFAR
jgi:CubicO group peptidase (beta-lactamase class C family)